MGVPENQVWLSRLHQNVQVVILNVNGKAQKMTTYLRCATSVRNHDLVISLSPAFIKILHMVRKIRRRKYQIVSWIHFWQSDPWKYLIDQNVDAVVLTSSFEGLPMVFLEAVARGIPVVSSRFAGYDDVVQDGVNGLSYVPDDIDGLVKTINRCSAYH